MSKLSDKVIDLHIALVGGDRTASAQLAELLLPEIIRHLSVKFREEDDHEYVEAATDALMDYLTDPEKFNPKMSRLDTYLKLIATRDMLNLRAKNTRRSSKVELVDPVELSDFEGNNEEDISRDPVLKELLKIADEEELARFVQQTFDNEIDRAIAELILDGVRETEEYAEVIGISGSPVDEQRILVKKHKDRVKLRLKRKAGEGK